MPVFLADDDKYYAKYHLALLANDLVRLEKLGFSQEFYDTYEPKSALYRLRKRLNL